MTATVDLSAWLETVEQLIVYLQPKVASGRLDADWAGAVYALGYTPERAASLWTRGIREVEA